MMEQNLGSGREKLGRYCTRTGGGKGWRVREMWGSKPRENTGRPDRHDDKRQILDGIRKNTPDSMSDISCNYRTLLAIL